MTTIEIGPELAGSIADITVAAVILGVAAVVSVIVAIVEAPTILAAWRGEREDEKK